MVRASGFEPDYGGSNPPSSAKQLSYLRIGPSASTRR